MMKLLIATKNQGKLLEFQSYLADLPIKLYGLKDFPDIADLEETGKSFEENAKLKAIYYAKYFNIMTITDDSGFGINALDGKPGIFSARYSMNEEGLQDYNFAFKKLIKELKAIKINNQDLSANFTCIIALTLPEYFSNNSRTSESTKINSNKDIITFKGQVFGSLTYPPRGNNGFGYDAIFTPNYYELTFAEMNFAEKQKISHRVIAMEKLKQYIKANILKHPLAENFS